MAFMDALLATDDGHEQHGRICAAIVVEARADVNGIFRRAGLGCADAAIR
jgi:hypothetical protein